MEGMFLRKKFNSWLFLLFACGLFFIGLYIFLNIVDPESTSELLTFLIMGILIILVVIPSWLLNFGAFIHIDEDSIKAKYHLFGKIDWTIFAIMGAIEIATVIATFYFAQKIGKNNVSIEKLQYTIQRRIIETQPLLPGNVIKVFADENYTVRLTFFGYPNQTSVYYAVQEFASDYTFFKSLNLKYLKILNSFKVVLKH